MLYKYIYLYIKQVASPAVQVLATWGHMALVREALHLSVGL